MLGVVSGEQICDPGKLVQLMRVGDLQALEHMVTCYGDHLAAMGIKHCCSEDDARDAVQDALLAAGTHLQDFRGDGCVEGWLGRMVINACKRMHRGRKNDVSLHVEHRDDMVAALEESPVRAAFRSQISLILSRTIAELEPRDQILLILSDQTDWRGPEIAEKLGMSAGAVRTRLSRIRRRLRGELAPVWEAWTEQG